MQQPGHGAAVGSLVCGIIGLVLAFVLYLFTAGAGDIIALVLGIVGLVLASNAKREGNMEGIRTAGFVLSLLALIFGALIFVTCGLCTICAVGSVGAAGWL